MHYERASSLLESSFPDEFVFNGTSLVASESM